MTDDAADRDLPEPSIGMFTEFRKQVLSIVKVDDDDARFIVAGIALDAGLEVFSAKELAHLTRMIPKVINARPELVIDIAELDNHLRKLVVTVFTFEAVARDTTKDVLRQAENEVKRARAEEHRKLVVLAILLALAIFVVAAWEALDQFGLLPFHAGILQVAGSVMLTLPALLGLYEVANLLYKPLRRSRK